MSLFLFALFAMFVLTCERESNLMKRRKRKLKEKRKEKEYRERKKNKNRMDRKNPKKINEQERMKM